MLSPERNDVNVRRLFHWHGSTKLQDAYGKEIDTVYVRLVGDVELNKARTFAIRKSAEMRKLLRSEDSDERIAFISSIDMVDSKEELVLVLQTLKIKDLSMEAAKEVKIPQPKEPKSDATLEEIEKWQKEVDAYPEVREKAVQNALLKKTMQYKESIENLDETTLRKEYEKLMIDYLCEQEMVDRFKEYCVFTGCFTDEEYKTHYFTSFEEFDNLPTEMKKQLIDYYNSLELNVDELKKSLEAMQ